jgi:hypothetical protein
MEATLNTQAAVEITIEKTEELKELTNVELMLVGGGLANFAFA